MTWRHYAKWSIHVHGSVNWVMTGSRNVLDPVMCQVITLTNAVSFVWNKIKYNDITNITSWKKLQGRLQSISAILTQPHWVDISFIVRRAGLLWSQQDFEWRWSVPLFKCFTVLEFSFILFGLCLLITFFNFIMNYVPIVTFWIFTYHKIWILSIMFCSIWSYWIIYFLACLEVSWRVVS